MKDFSAWGQETMIRVNVPGTTGFYRLRCDAFFTVTKGQFAKMIKALKADTETATDNAKTLFDFAHYMQESHIDNAFFEKNAERIAVINSIWNPENKCFQVSKEEEKAYKAFKACASDKKSYRPLLFQPFEFNNRIYCTDSFIAARYDREIESFYDSYITEDQEHNAAGDYLGTARPNMEKIFSDFEENRNNYFPVSIPDLKTLKTWAKGKKNEAPAVFKYAMKTYSYIFQVQHIQKAAALTLSDTLYITDGERPAYMTGNGYTVVILNMKVSDAAFNAACEKAPGKALIKVCTDTYGNEGFQVLPLADDKKENTVSMETEEAAEAKDNNAGAPAGKEFSDHETGAVIISNASNTSDAFQEEKTEDNAAAYPKKVYKIAGIEYTGKELETIISDKKYLVSYRTVYGIERTKRGYNAVKLAYLDKKYSYVPIIARGYHVFMTLENVLKTFPCFPTEFYCNDTVLLTVKPSETVPGNNDNVRQAETAENRTEGNDNINTKGIGKTSENQRKTGITEDIKTDTVSGYPVSENMSKCTNCTESNNIEYLHKMNNSGNPGIVPYTESAGVQVSATDTDTFPSALSALEKLSATPEETENPSANPHEVPADDHGYSMESFNKVFCHMYNHLYNAREYHADLVNRFDHELNAFEVGLLKALAEYRQDFITSDREAAAFCMALDRLKYVEKKVPENTPVPLDTKETVNNIAVSAFNSIPETMNTDTVIPDTETRVSRMTAKNGKYQPVQSDTVIHSHCPLPFVYTAYTPSYGRNNAFCDIRNGIGPPG